MRVNVLVLTVVGIVSVARGQFVTPMQNAPFSADWVETRVQTLADGTHITSPDQTSRIYRDSLGRTRTERYVQQSSTATQAVLNPTNITIVDPVEGIQYMLDTRMTVAHKITMAKRPAATPTAGSQGALPPPTASLGAAPQVLVTSPAIQMYPATGAIGAIASPFGGGPPAIQPQSKSEKLGTQTIEGVVAEGQRTTTTWPIGAIGNDREITTMSESWRSAELGMIVMSKNSDPRTGERTMKLTNVSRAEPDPSLFQVPADYTIEDQPSFGRVQSSTPAQPPK